MPHFRMPISLVSFNLTDNWFLFRLFGCKWTIALSFITYMPFMLAQFYPHLYTLIPGGLAVGLGGGPLWCAKCTYLTVIAEAYSTLIGSEKKEDATVVRFFGLFFLFYQMAQVWGNLISSSGEKIEKIFYDKNESVIHCVFHCFKYFVCSIVIW